MPGVRCARRGLGGVPHELRRLPARRPARRADLGALAEVRAVPPSAPGDQGARARAAWRRCTPSPTSVTSPTNASPASQPAARRAPSGSSSASWASSCAWAVSREASFCAAVTASSRRGLRGLAGPHPVPCGAVNDQRSRVSSGRSDPGPLRQSHAAGRAPATRRPRWAAAPAREERPGSPARHRAQPAPSRARPAPRPSSAAAERLGAPGRTCSIAASASSLLSNAGSVAGPGGGQTS